MLADRIFGASGAARSAPAQEAACSWAKAKARGAAARARQGPRLAGGDAAPPRPRRLVLHRPGGLSRLRHLPRLERRHRSATAPRRRSRMRWERGRSSSPSPSGSSAIALILRPFLPSPRSVAVGVVAIACGLLLALAAQTAGLGPDGCPQGPLRPRLLPAPRRRHRRDALLGDDHALPAASARRSSRCCSCVSGLLLISGRSVSDMVRARRRRGFGRAKRGTVGFATAVKESRIRTDPDLIDTSPASTEPIFGPPEPIDGGEDEYKVLARGDDDQETAKFANFDEAVRVADEPDTSELDRARGGRTGDDQGCQAGRRRRRIRPEAKLRRWALMAKPSSPPGLPSSTALRWARSGAASPSRRRSTTRCPTRSGCSSAALPTRGRTRRTTRPSRAPCWRRSATSASRRGSSAPSPGPM